MDVNLLVCSHSNRKHAVRLFVLVLFFFFILSTFKIKVRENLSSFLFPPGRGASFDFLRQPFPETILKIQRTSKKKKTFSRSSKGTPLTPPCTSSFSSSSRPSSSWRGHTVFKTLRQSTPKFGPTAGKSPR